MWSFQIEIQHKVTLKRIYLFWAFVVDHTVKCHCQCWIGRLYHVSLIVILTFTQKFPGHIFLVYSSVPLVMSMLHSPSYLLMSGNGKTLLKSQTGEGIYIIWQLLDADVLFLFHCDHVRDFQQRVACRCMWCEQDMQQRSLSQNQTMAVVVMWYAR